MKATIRKSSTFFVNSLSINFGAVLINDHPQQGPQLVITNTSKQPRAFECHVDHPLYYFGFCDARIQFELDEGSGNRTFSKEIEDQIEGLEQKIKIAQRKGNLDKVKRFNFLSHSTKSAGKNTYGQTGQLAWK